MSKAIAREDNRLVINKSYDKELLDNEPGMQTIVFSTIGSDFAKMALTQSIKQSSRTSRKDNATHLLEATI